MGEVETKRPVPFSPQESNSLFVKHIGRVAAECDSATIHIENRVKRGALSFHSNPMVETGTSRVIVAHVPLANVGGLVTSSLQHLRKRLQLVTSLAAVGVVENAMMTGVESGEQTRSDRRAEWRSAEGISKPRTLAGNAVDVGSANKRMPAAPQIVPAQVIDQNHNHVRRSRLLRLLRCLGQRMEAHRNRDAHQSQGPGLSYSALVVSVAHLVFPTVVGPSSGRVFQSSI